MILYITNLAAYHSTGIHISQFCTGESLIWKTFSQKKRQGKKLRASALGWFLKIPSRHHRSEKNVECYDENGSRFRDGQVGNFQQRNWYIPHSTSYRPRISRLQSCLLLCRQSRHGLNKHSVGPKPTESWRLSWLSTLQGVGILRAQHASPTERSHVVRTRAT